MRGYVMRKYAHPADIPLSDDAPEPVPSSSQVLVDVYSSALNFFDILQAQGKHQHQPSFPFILGVEFAGRIAQTSPIPRGCPFKPGDRVFGSAQGTYADRTAAEWKDLYPVPKGMTMDEAAGLFVTWPTSYEGLVGRGQLQPGEWVLVIAGAGGVGLSAVQLAKALGARVIATAGSQEKLQVCKKYGGADYTLDYTKPGWQKQVLAITGGSIYNNADVIYDPVGKIRECLKCIAWKGRAVVVGFAGGEIEKLPLNLVLLKNISIVGIHWGAYAKFDPSHITTVWHALMELFESGKVKPTVYSEVWELEDLGLGLRALENRQTWGKAVVRIKREAERNKL